MKVVLYIPIAPYILTDSMEHYIGKKRIVDLGIKQKISYRCIHYTKILPLHHEIPKVSPRMDKKFVDKVSYMISVISDFAALHSLSNAQSYRYLNRYKGLDFIDKHYEVMHTQPFEDVIIDLTAYCKRQGEALV